MKKPESQAPFDEPPRLAPEAREARGVLLDRAPRALEPAMDFADGDDNTRMAYSRLAMRLERDLSQGERGASVLIMAAHYERVAVEASTELAWHFAEDLGRTVLLVDGSFGRNGCLTKALGAVDEPGLLDILASEASRQRLACGRAPYRPSRHFLCAPRRAPGAWYMPPARAGALRQFLAAACTMADFVLIQGPAVSRASRTLAFGPLVDAALLIALEANCP